MNTLLCILPLDIEAKVYWDGGKFSNAHEVRACAPEKVRTTQHLHQRRDSPKAAPVASLTDKDDEKIQQEAYDLPDTADENLIAVFNKR